MNPHRVMGGKKSDEGDDDEEEDGDEDEDEGDEDEDEGGDEKDAPVLRFGPPKRHSGSGRVKSVIRHDQDVVDANLASSIDGNIFIFVTVN
jgi:hypothetical protein